MPHLRVLRSSPFPFRLAFVHVGEGMAGALVVMEEQKGYSHFYGIFWNLPNLPAGHSYLVYYLMNDN